MFTVFNNTDIKFKTKKWNLKEGRTNLCLSLNYGKRFLMDLFVPEESVQKTIDNFNGANSEFVTWLKNTRLYYNNKDYAPIAVNTKSNGANFLFLAHKLEETEKVLRVELDGVFALAKAFKKGSFITTVASFRTDRDSSLTIVSLNGDTVYTTKYAATKLGEFTRTVETTPAKQYKKYDLKSRGHIKAYRPAKPTHLIFADGKDKLAAESLFNETNNTVIYFNNQKELTRRIEEYKELGFTAASFFSSISKEEGSDALTPLAKTYLKAIINNFKTAHHVFEDGFTLIVSKKQQPIRPSKKANNKELKDKKPQNKADNKNQNVKIQASSRYGKKN